MRMLPSPSPDFAARLTESKLPALALAFGLIGGLLMDFGSPCPRSGSRARCRSDATGSIPAIALTTGDRAECRTAVTGNRRHRCDPNQGAGHHRDAGFFHLGRPARTQNDSRDDFRPCILGIRRRPRG